MRRNAARVSCDSALGKVRRIVDGQPAPEWIATRCEARAGPPAAAREAPGWGTSSSANEQIVSPPTPRQASRQGDDHRPPVSEVAVLRATHSTTTEASHGLGQSEREFEHGLGLQFGLAARGQNGAAGGSRSMPHSSICIHACIACQQRDPAEPLGDCRGSAVAASPRRRVPALICRTQIAEAVRDESSSGPALSKATRFGKTTTSAPASSAARAAFRALRVLPRRKTAAVLDDGDAHDCSRSVRHGWLTRT